MRKFQCLFSICIEAIIYLSLYIYVTVYLTNFNFLLKEILCSDSIIKSPSLCQKYLKGARKLEASVKNESICYLSTMRDNIWTLLVILSLQSLFTTLQLGSNINFGQII